MSTTVTTRFSIKHPVVLAPMDEVAGGRLAAAVSRAGGLGLIGGGYGDSAWLQREFDRAEGARVGCGFITWSLARDPRLLDLALEREPAVVMFSFGDPTAFIERAHSAGVPTICQVPSVEQARSALDAGADALVAQGGEAGGHSTSERSTFTLVPEVADLIAETAPGTPLLAAGGVADGRGLTAALALGADGVLVGTRLWASEEALVPTTAQERVVASTGDHTVRTSVYDIVRGAAWPPSYTLRALKNAFVDRWHGDENGLTNNLAQARRTFQKAKAAEDFDEANVTVGEAIGQIQHIQPAAEILDELVRDAERTATHLESDGQIPSATH